MQLTDNTAPELAVTRWFNTLDNPTLADLRGEVVVIETFQMLCPGCVSHGLPQAKRIQQNFGDDITLLGLHTVFEHHDAMTPVSLEAFLHEYQITFPVGVDAHTLALQRQLRWAAIGCAARQACSSSTVPDASASTPLVTLKTSPSAPPSPASSTNHAPTRRSAAAPRIDQMSRHCNPTLDGDGLACLSQ